MFEYDWINLLFREYFAGVWAVSSFALLVVIGRALVAEMRSVSRPWADYVVRGIGALWLCIAGAFVRAFTRWVELIHINLDIDPGIWSSWVLLVPAGLLFIGGQILCIFAYTPRHWRWFALWGSLAATVTLPAIVAALVYMRIDHG